MHHVLESIIIAIFSQKCIKPECLEHRDLANKYLYEYVQTNNPEYSELSKLETKEYNLCKMGKKWK